MEYNLKDLSETIVESIKICVGPEWLINYIKHNYLGKTQWALSSIMDYFYIEVEISSNYFAFKHKITVNITNITSGDTFVFNRKLEKQEFIKITDNIIFQEEILYPEE